MLSFSQISEIIALQRYPFRNEQVERGSGGMGGLLMGGEGRGGVAVFLYTEQKRKSLITAQTIPM